MSRSASLPLRPTAWSDAVTLDQIDPALIIDTITPSLTGTVSSTVVAINGDLIPSAFASTSSVVVTLDRPDGTAWLSTTPSASTSATLPAATGTGPAAPTLLTASGSDTRSITYGPTQAATSDAAALVGTGQVQLPVTASASVHATGPGNLQATFSTQAGATVSVQAQVERTTLNSGDTTSSGITTTGGFFTSGNYNILPPFVVIGGPSLPDPVTTAPQTVTIGPVTTGAAPTVTVNGFDPALGWLDHATLTFAVGATGSVAAENLDSAPGTVTVSQIAGMKLSDQAGTVLVSGSANFIAASPLAAFDGTADYAGASAANWTRQVQPDLNGTASRANFAGAGFVGAGPVTLTASTTGSTTLDGPGNLDIATTLQADAQLSVSYTYWPTDLRYIDATAQTSGTANADPYAGPVAGLERQYIWSSPDSASIVAAAPNMFLKSGAGDDSLQAASGTNVLDGAGGSNFLIGSATGTDTFFVDARGAATTWSTIVNFHPGDMATIFGFTDGSARTLAASDGVGAYTGVTIHAETAGAGTGVNASMTFAGIDAATADAHFVYTTGTLPGNVGYLLIQYS